MKKFWNRTAGRSLGYFAGLALLLSAVFYRYYHTENTSYREVLRHSEERAVLTR